MFEPVSDVYSLLENAGLVNSLQLAYICPSETMVPVRPKEPFPVVAEVVNGLTVTFELP